MASVDLKCIPRWTLVRSEAGPITPDNAVIDTTNYPLTKMFHNPDRASHISVYWDAGTPTAGDRLDLELLVGEGGATGIEGWVRAANVSNVEIREVVELPTMGASALYMRVSSATVDVLSADLEMYAAYE